MLCRSSTYVGQRTSRRVVAAEREIHCDTEELVVVNAGWVTAEMLTDDAAVDVALEAGQVVVVGQSFC